jgi:hypothetical protein
MHGFVGALGVGGPDGARLVGHAAAMLTRGFRPLSGFDCHSTRRIVFANAPEENS